MIPLFMNVETLISTTNTRRLQHRFAYRWNIRRQRASMSSISTLTGGITLRKIWLKSVLRNRQSQLAISTASRASTKVLSASGIDTMAPAFEEAKILASLITARTKTLASISRSDLVGFFASGIPGAGFPLCKLSVDSALDDPGYRCCPVRFVREPSETLSLRGGVLQISKNLHFSSSEY